MEDSDPTLTPQDQSEVATNTDKTQDKSEVASDKDKTQKQKVGQLFGVQLSAPKGMKNPLRIFGLLVFGNFLLLFLVAKALGLF